MAKVDDKIAAETEIHWIWDELNAQRVEQGEIKSTLATVLTKLDGLATTLSMHNRRLDNVQDGQASLSKTDWQTWLAAGSLLLAIVVLWGTGLLNPVDVRLATVEKQVQGLTSRELQDAYHRGESDQKFLTLESQLDSAINNRKDIDNKHTDAQESLQSQILLVKDDLAHLLDNGLGRRIQELLAPVVAQSAGSQIDIKKIEADLTKVIERLSAIESRQERDEREVRNKRIADDEDKD